EHAGLHTIGMDLKARDEVVSAASLAAFIGRHAPDVDVDELAGAPEAAIVVRRVEALKTLVRVGAIDGASESATDKTSLDADIRLLMDPTSTSPGSAVAMRTYAGDGSAKGVTVTATHLETGRRVSCVTDREGIGHVKLAWPGAWRMEFHKVTAPTDEAGWMIESSTVTFEVREVAP
ncbi:MAG: hypothetical protein ACF8LL_13565, partial [Phycisphaerales bacterium]